MFLLGPIRACANLVLPDAFLPKQVIAANLDRLELALELDEALPTLLRERAVCERLADRAAGLLVVVAVGETAVRRDLFDVAEELAKLV